MFARDASRGVGSEARGEGRERGFFTKATSKPPVAQRAGGILCCIRIHVEELQVKGLLAAHCVARAPAARKATAAKKKEKGEDESSDEAAALRSM